MVVVGSLPVVISAVCLIIGPGGQLLKKTTQLRLSDGEEAGAKSCLNSQGEKTPVSSTRRWARKHYDQTTVHHNYG